MFIPLLSTLWTITEKRWPVSTACTTGPNLQIPRSCLQRCHEGRSGHAPPVHRTAGRSHKRASRGV